MQRLGRSFIRIVKGPTGGFLASLGIAAAQLNPDPTSDATLASRNPATSGGQHTEADPTGRGAPVDPTESGHQPPWSPNGSGSAGRGTSSGAVRSAGAVPAHQDARDDPPPTSDATHDQGQHRHGSPGHQGSGSGDDNKGSSSGHGDPGSGGQSDGKGSGGSGGSDSGHRGDSSNGHSTR